MEVHSTNPGRAQPPLCLQCCLLVPWVTPRTWAPPGAALRCADGWQPGAAHSLALRPVCGVTGLRSSPGTFCFPLGCILNPGNPPSCGHEIPSPKFPLFLSSSPRHCWSRCPCTPCLCAPKPQCSAGPRQEQRPLDGDMLGTCRGAHCPHHPGTCDAAHPQEPNGSGHSTVLCSGGDKGSVHLCAPHRALMASAAPVPARDPHPLCAGGTGS